MSTNKIDRRKGYDRRTGDERRMRIHDTERRAKSDRRRAVN